MIKDFGKEKFFKFLKLVSKNDSDKNIKDVFYKIYKVKFTKIELKKMIEKYNKK